MIKVKFKETGKEFYFQFFKKDNKNEFWYTPTTESFGFNIGNINDFEPINITWKEIYEKRLD